jgi:hypothetical protein
MNNSATYHFIPWVRRGLSSLLREDVTGKRAILDVVLTISAAGGSTKDIPKKTVELIGPGDIVGFDPGIVTRIDPPVNVSDFEPNYFPAIEFAEPDFPWRFTAAGPDSHARLTPWISLIVLKVEEFDEGDRNQSGQIPWIQVHNGSSLPDLNAAWRWAHVQLSGEGNLTPQALQTTLANTIQTNPERVVSRLLCARRLERGVLYHAFVVPTFKLGILPLKNLPGVDIPENTSACTPAWKNSDTKIHLPYYFRWEFRTGGQGDFEDLVRLLKRHQLTDIGLRQIDCSSPGYDLPGVRRDQMIQTSADGGQLTQAEDLRSILQLEGALKSLDTQYSPWGADAVIREVTIKVAPSLTSVIVTWRTTCASISEFVYYESGKPDQRRSIPGNTTAAADHSVNIDSLLRDTEYHYQILARFTDSSGGNVSVITLDATFSTSASQTLSIPPDKFRESLATGILNKPVVGIVGPTKSIQYPDEGILSEITAQISGPDAWITWETPQEATSRVDYSRITESGDRIEYHQIKSEYVSTHRILLRQLIPDTTYTFSITSVARNNTSSTIKAEFITPPLPCVVPPIYGRWHAARPSVDPALPSNRTPNWVDELNLDPRHRTIAGMGASVIKEQQEPLMASAWQQLGAINEANKILRDAQLGRESTGIIHSRLKDLGDEDYLRLTASVHTRTKIKIPTIGNTALATVSQVLGETPIPEAALDPAFRRVSRKRGPLHRHLHLHVQPAPNGPRQDILEKFNTDQNRLVVAGLPPMPQGMLKFEDVARDDTSVHTVEKTGPRSISALEKSVFIKFEPNNMKNLKGALKGALGKLTVSVTVEDTAIDAIFGGWLPVPDKQPDAKKVASLQEIKDQLHDALRPDETIPKRVWSQLEFQQNAAAQSGDHQLETIMAAPEFPQPMCEPLRDLSQEFLLPGLDQIPQNTLGLLETNRRFVEAYLCGCNHEFAAELLWREYPTDQRGSYFRQFWDTGDYLPPSDMDAEKLKDIKPLHTWDDTRLGGHATKETQEAESLVLIIRGDLLKKYPKPTIYAVEAREQGGRRFPALAEYFRTRLDQASAGIEKAVIETSALSGQAYAMVKWITQSRATSQVDWWEDNDPSHPRNEGNNEYLTEHLVRLDDLKADTPYHLRISSETEELVEYKIDDIAFMTPPEPIFPVFSGTLNPDILFDGFPFTAEMALGEGSDSKYPEGLYFVLEERISETRFGMDASVPGNFKTWNDLSWGHMPVGSGEYVNDNRPSSEPANTQGRKWGTSSATVAWITLQKPVQMVMHASEMIPAAR